MADNKEIKHCDCECCKPVEKPTEEQQINQYLDKEGLTEYTKEFKEWIWKLFRKVHARIGHVEEDLAKLKSESKVDYELVKSEDKDNKKIIYTLIEKNSGTEHGQIEISSDGQIIVHECIFKKVETSGHEYDEKFTNPIGEITGEMTLNDLDGMKISQVITMMLFNNQKPKPAFPEVNIDNSKISQTNKATENADFVLVTLNEGISSCTDDRFVITGPVYIYNGNEYTSLDDINDVLAEDEIKYGSISRTIDVKYHAVYKEDASYESDLTGTITIKPKAIPNVSLNNITIDEEPYQPSNVYELEDNKLEISANVNLGALTHGKVYATYNGVEYPIEIIDGKVILTIDNLESSEDIQNIVLTVKNEQYNKSTEYTIQIKYEIPDQIYAGIIKYSDDDFESPEQLFEFVESGDIDIYDDNFLYEQFVDIQEAETKEKEGNTYYKFAPKTSTNQYKGFVLLCTTVDPENVIIYNNTLDGTPDLDRPEEFRLSEIQIPSPNKESISMNAIYMVNPVQSLDPTSTFWIKFK